MIRCVVCGQALTEDLVEVDPDFEPVYADYQEIVPPGHFWQTTYRIHPDVEPVIMINSADLRNVVADAPWAVGCCGNSGDAGTHRCGGCDNWVATQIDDCHTGYYTYLRSDLVTVDGHPAEPRVPERNVRNRIGMAAVHRHHARTVVLSMSRTEDHRWFEDSVTGAVDDRSSAQLGNLAERAVKRSHVGTPPAWPGPLAQIIADDRRRNVFPYEGALVHVVAVDGAVSVIPTERIKHFGPLQHHDLATTFEGRLNSISAETLGDAINTSLDLVANV